MIRLVIILFLFFCTQSYAADTPKIGVLIKSTKYEFWRTIEQALKDTAKQKNMNVIVVGNTNPNDAQEQLNVCETLLLQNPDALIVAPVNLSNLTPCLRKANQQNIPVIDIDGNITRDSAKQLKIDAAFSVAANNTLLGQRAAEYLDGKQGKVLILEGLAGSLPSEERVSGFKAHLPNSDLEIVASLPTDWDRFKAYDITKATLLKHPDLKIVFAAADAMALGAYEAAISMGKGELIIIGVDGNAEAQQAIRNGKMSASIAQLPLLMVEDALTKTVEYLDGKDFKFEQYLPTLVITKDVLESGTDPLLTYLR